MKYILIYILLTLLIYARTVDCAVPSIIATKAKSIFKHKIDFNKIKVNIKVVTDAEEALSYISHEGKTKFAIVRRDVLWLLQKNKTTFQYKYIILSELPFTATLYLVQGADGFTVNLDSLEKKHISIGILGELNSYYLKALLEELNLKNRIFYKSLAYTDSIEQITDKKLDAYFGFLPPSKKSNKFYFQTLFSEETEEYFKQKNIFNIDYNGISSPYVIVASLAASDEEIESIIYRLMEKEIFVPITDEKFGMINRYVLNHLEEVRKVLELRSKNNSDTSKKEIYLSKQCRQYHYGFLKLLRQKPAWKKKLKRLDNFRQEKILLQELNNVLLQIDKQKSLCDLKFLKKQKQKFKNIKDKI